MHTNDVLHCPHCGTSWYFRTKGPADHTGWSGFLHSTVKYHRLHCENASPEERLKFIERNEKRLAKKPNKHTITVFNKNHPGVARAAHLRVETENGGVQVASQEIERTTDV